ncbi:MAG: hypothetical protein OEZ59_02635 [Deltaproteobacteria bacterium]|nr:hypothetical protein [Deltaproteobacteria bacterium]
MRSRFFNRPAMILSAFVLAASAMMLTPVAQAQIATTTMMAMDMYDPIYPFVQHRSTAMPINPGVVAKKGSVAFSLSGDKGQSRYGNGDESSYKSTGWDLGMSGTARLKLAGRDETYGPQGEETKAKSSAGLFAVRGESWCLGVKGEKTNHASDLNNMEGKTRVMGIGIASQPFYFGISSSVDQVKHDFNAGIEQEGQRKGRQVGVGLADAFFKGAFIALLEYDSEDYQAFDNELVGGEVKRDSLLLEFLIMGSLQLGFRSVSSEARDIYGTAGFNASGKGKSIGLGYAFENGVNIKFQSFKSSGEVDVVGLKTSLEQDFKNLSITKFF